MFTTCFHPAYIFNLHLSFFQIILCNSDQQGRPPLFDIEPARRAGKNLLFGPNPVAIPLGTQIQIRVCRPQTGRQSGKKFDTVAAYSSDIGLYLKELPSKKNAEECSAPPCRPPCSRQTLAALV